MVRQNPEPRWPAGIAVIAIGGLFVALPSSLTFAGSRWLLLGIVLVMMVPIVILHRIGRHFLNQILGYILNGVVTAAMIVSLVLLISMHPPG